jgi:NitT/TauT family transport system ATP-binding protein
VTAAIELHRIERRFGDLDAVRGVDLRVEPGEFVTLLGASGCGKTTLLRIAAGLDLPTTGSVSIDGLDPVAARAAKRIGWVPQHPALLPWRTARDNVLLVHQVNRRRGAPRPDVDELLGRVGLAGFEDALPHQLSGGMQQRVALVRAFSLGPDVLLMDEPFAALDEITREDMRHLLLELWERSRTTVLFVTHSVAEAAYLSDRVVVMASRPGRVSADVRVVLPRPRRPELEEDPEFFGLTTQLSRLLHEARS